jgi:hypothetical protein
MSKLSAVLAAATVSGGLLCYEHGHRIVIERETAATAACADRDSVPYSADCLLFLGGEAVSGLRGAPTVTAKAVSAGQPGGAPMLPAGAPCPDNDNVPYSALCLEYLSGWHWRSRAAEAPAPPIGRR